MWVVYGINCTCLPWQEMYIATVEFPVCRVATQLDLYNVHSLEEVDHELSHISVHGGCPYCSYKLFVIDL